MLEYEVDHYIVTHGRAFACFLGMLRITELRGKAQRALGSEFNLPAFQDVVVRASAAPMDVLDKIVNQRISDR